MVGKFKLMWCWIRRISGDDAYDRYLEHFSKHHQAIEGHQNDAAPLSKAEFFKQWQDRKWNGIKRCC